MTAKQRHCWSKQAAFHCCIRGQYIGLERGPVNNADDVNNLVCRCITWLLSLYAAPVGIDL